MKKQNFLLVLLCTMYTVTAFCQELLPPLERFSTKKQGYLIKNDDTRIDFVLDDLDRKKGLIVKVEGKSTDGKKFTLKAEDIKVLAIPPSGWSKFAALDDATRSVAKTSRTKTNELNRELVYFYQEKLEDRKITALMQLLNPDFSEKIRIYHDPFAMETMGFAVAGIQLTGGIDKSYYLRVDGKTRRFFKKDYDDDFKTLFGSCEALKTKYKDFAWRDMPRHLFFFENECN